MVSKKRALEAVRHLREASHDATAVFSDSFWDDVDALCEYVDGKELAEEELDQHFQEIYPPYPKKVAPDSAKRALKKAIKREGVEVVAVMKKAIERHATEWARLQTEKQFIPNLASWINAGRYKDVMPSAAIAQKRHGLTL